MKLIKSLLFTVVFTFAIAVLPVQAQYQCGTGGDTPTGRVMREVGGSYFPVSNANITIETIWTGHSLTVEPQFRYETTNFTGYYTVDDGTGFGLCAVSTYIITAQHNIHGTAPYLVENYLGGTTIPWIYYPAK